MIPPRPSRPLSAPKRPAANQLQLNRLFDDESEIEPYLKTNFSGREVKIVRTWKVIQIVCIVELGEKPKEEKKKK